LDDLLAPKVKPEYKIEQIKTRDELMGKVYNELITEFESADQV
jgi:hypothetical protein